MFNEQDEEFVLFVDGRILYQITQTRYHIIIDVVCGFN